MTWFEARSVYHPDNDEACWLFTRAVCIRVDQIVAVEQAGAQCPGCNDDAHHRRSRVLVAGMWIDLDHPYQELVALVMPHG